MGEKELSHKGKIVRDIVAALNSYDNFTERASKASAVSELEGFDYPPFFQSEIIQLPHHANMEKLVIEDSKIQDGELSTFITPHDESSGLTQNPEEKYVILHLHGGGYVGAFKKNYHRVAGYYSEVSHGMDVYSLDYRVAPEFPFPAAVQDAVDAFHYILAQGIKADHIFIGGDSAGGGLGLALSMYLRDEKGMIPAGLILMSPWADTSASGPSYTENTEIDPVFGGSRSALIFENPYAMDADKQNPMLSPAFGDFAGLPPMLVQTGTDEMLLSDSETVAEKAKNSGVKIRYTKYEGMFHVFQMAGPIMEESSRAWTEVGKFINAVKNLADL